MVVTSKMFGLMRRIAQERDGVATEGRDLIWEAMGDRGYSTNPWATHRLANGKGAEATPVVGAGVPNNVLIEPVEQIEETPDGPRRVVKWIGNGGRWGPADTVEQLEIMIYGQKGGWV
jgi:hypothetical protein